MPRAKSSTSRLVSNYFDELKAILVKYGLEGKGDRIYNVDEAGFNCEHKPVKVVARKSSRRPQFITSPRSALTTLITCGNAAGDSLPPFIIYKGKKVMEQLRKGGLPGTRVEISDSGWSNSSLFETFLKSHFTPYVNARRKEGEPVILIYDGHKSHVSIPVIKHARANNIILFVLPAHTSHFLQPLDVGVFSPMKAYYNGACSRYLREHPGEVITRYNLTHLIGEAYLHTVTQANLQAGFRATGIHPFHPERVDTDLICCPSTLVNQSQQPEAEPNGTPATSTTGVFLNSRRPIPPKTSEDNPKKRKFRWQPAGIAVTEDDNFQKICEANKSKANCDGDAGDDDVTPALKQPRHAKGKRVKDVRTRVGDSQIPGPSGIDGKRGEKVKDSVQRKLVFDHEEQDDDVVDDDSSSQCCVCHESIPRQVDRTHVFIIDWVKCDKCTHWVHLRYCCRWFRAPKAYLCPCCDDN